MMARDRIRLKHLQRQAEGYLELGMAQQVLDTLAKIGDPETFGAHLLYLQGEALRSLQRYEEAIAPLEKAAEGDPRNIQIWIALGWCYKRTGRLPLAIQTIQSALEVEPTEAVLHYNLACYLSLAGEKHRAIRALARALKIDPHYRELVEKEPDFDPIRNDPDFLALTNLVV
ncbi:MAG TPA: tetratricopeptide repeat protein [Thermoguttaceae bacterium]|nr:tetratricopeptide repeat protein [Thermoguttaceae bacterium]